MPPAEQRRSRARNFHVDNHLGKTNLGKTYNRFEQMNIEAAPRKRCLLIKHQLSPTRRWSPFGSAAPHTAPIIPCQEVAAPWERCPLTRRQLSPARGGRPSRALPPHTAPIIPCTRWPPLGSAASSHGANYPLHEVAAILERCLLTCCPLTWRQLSPTKRRPQVSQR